MGKLQELEEQNQEAGAELEKTYLDAEQTLLELRETIRAICSDQG